MINILIFYAFIRSMIYLFFGERRFLLLFMFLLLWRKRTSHFTRKINASITLLILKYDTDLKLKSIVLKNVLFFVKMLE